MGEVKLHSTNPSDPPLINPKYLTNKDDIVLLVDGTEINEISMQYIKNCSANHDT